MIVPRLRLMAVAAIVLVPVSALAAYSAVWTPAAIGVAVFLSAVAAMDAAGGGRRFEGIGVSVPAIVRMTVDHEGTIELTVRKPRDAIFVARLGMALPGGVTADDRDQQIRLAASHEKVRVVWPCRALRRGCYRIDQCIIELPTRWGLWGVRRRFALDCEIRIYPNLVSGQKHILGLFNRRELGWRIMRKVGKGREFEQLRDYLPGDNFEDIDWKATARRRHPVTRVYQVEQSQEIFVILDASRLSTRSAGYLRDRRRRERQASSQAVSSIFERYVTAALLMAMAADRAADRYGLLIFGAQPDLFIKAGRGRAHYNACREALYNRMPRNESPDFDELFTFIGNRLRKRALLLFLTHLDDPLLTESFIKAMEIAARRHVMMVNMCRPPGAYPLFSSSDVYQGQGIYEHLVGHMMWSSLSDTRRKLRQYGAGFALLDQGELCSQLIGQYIEVKQRQIL